MIKLGLVGYPLGHSFSAKWFREKGYEFENFEIQSESLKTWIKNLPKGIRGFGVTIPHKCEIIKYLDRVDSVAMEIGAVNCVVIGEGGETIGYNTDGVGFLKDFSPLNTSTLHKAAVLGSGGASRAVLWALKKLGIETDVISRKNGKYKNFDPSAYQAIINTTPLGMYPNIDTSPSIDYHKITPNTICYDLVYNPAMTTFLFLCKKQGAIIKGGIGMLTAQGEVALLHYEAQR